MIRETLVIQAQAGDKRAFQSLYEEVYEDMYRMAYYLLQNKEDAEDAVSEAVFDMYRSIAGLRKRDAFKAWAMKILSVKCKLKMREYSYRRGDEAINNDYADTLNMEHQVVQRTDIMRALKLLKKEEQIIVVCSAIAGMSSDEVGSITGLKSATVRTKLRRALAKMKSRLEAGV